MYKMTLIEFITLYKPKTIQLVYEAHIVNIDTTCMGSNNLIKVFGSEKYKLISFKNNHLIVEY